MKILGTARHRPARAPDGDWCLYFKREGEGRAHTVMHLPKCLHPSDVERVKRWLRRQPADMPLPAVVTGAIRLYGPLAVARQVRAMGGTWDECRLAASRCAVPELGVSPDDAAVPIGDGMRGTWLTPTGRWIGPDGKPFVGDVPAVVGDSEALVPVNPVSRPGPLQ